MISSLKAVILIVSTVFLCNCAGPTTPFGAQPLSALFREALSRITARVPSSNGTNQADIRFTPMRQVLHGRSRFTAIIEDPLGVRKDFRLTINYNGIDMTEKYLSQAEIRIEGNKVLRISFPNLRLPPHRDHEIEITYWRSPEDDSPKSQCYHAPRCYAFRPMPVRTTGDFKMASKYIQFITDLSQVNHINPNFIAGLIAQESGFDPQAVSRFKAIGLTQVTSSGEADIIDNYKDWPRFPEISTMPAPLVKLNIMTGAINSLNEWRLDPKLSIAGGIAYISRLDEYWRRPETLGVVSSNYENPDEILTALLLASYNSGASRVNSAIHKYGSHWLTSEQELSEARKYVNRVISFCDYFSSGEEENATSP